MSGDDWKPMPKDAAERSRATMWDVVRFAEYHAYDAIAVENVVDVCQWVLYPAWLAALQRPGYRFREVFLNSMHAGHSNMDAAPQSRDRVYIVCWRKGVTAPKLDLRSSCRRPLHTPLLMFKLHHGSAAHALRAQQNINFGVS